MPLECGAERVELALLPVKVARPERGAPVEVERNSNLADHNWELAEAAVASLDQVPELKEVAAARGRVDDDRVSARHRQLV